MAETGHNWEAWQDLDLATPIVLTQGGTIADTSATVSLDTKSACEVSIDADYSNHAIAAGTGLYVYVLREVGVTDTFEDINDAPWGFMMPTVLNTTRRRTFTVDPGSMGNFRILLRWTNTTGSAVATIATAYRRATVPVAS